MRAKLTLTVVAFLLLGTLSMADMASAATLGACSTDKVTNPRPDAWYSLGKPATMYSDDCFHQFMTNEPDTATIDVFIIPPAGPLALRDISLLRQSVEMWSDGIRDMALATGRAWLADGLEINAYVAGVDIAPPEAIYDPEILIVTADAEAGVVIGFAGIGTDLFDACRPVQSPFPTAAQVAMQPGFDDHHGDGWGTLNVSCGNNGGRVCLVAQAALFVLPDTEMAHNVYDLNSHEFGHCLGVGHVGDASDFGAKAYPPDDIMSYESDPHQVGYALCVSNLDVMTLAWRYQPMIAGAPPRENVNLGAGYIVMEGGRDPWGPAGPTSWRIVKEDGTLSPDAADCPQPTVDLLASPLAPEDDDPTPGGGSPAVEITSPADGSDVSAGPLAVSGTVDRASGAGFAVDAGGPYFGPSGSAIAIAATVSGGVSPSCAWSGADATFADANACSTTVTYAADGAKTITVTATEGSSSDDDDATVNVGAGGSLGTRIGTDAAGDRQAACGTGAPAGCDLTRADPAYDGLDLRAAYVRENGDAIRFTAEVEDASKFFQEASPNPAGNGHVNSYILSVSFEVVSPSFGLVQGNANIERAAGSPTATGTLSQVTGVLSSTTPNAGPVTVDLANNLLSVDIPKSSINGFAQVGSLSALNAGSTLNVENGNVDSLIAFDLDLDTIENPTWSAAASLVPSDPADLLPSTTVALGQGGTESLYFHHALVPVGNVDIVFGGSSMDATAPTAALPSVTVIQNQFSGTNVRTIYDATWLYTGAVDMDGATVKVDWYAATVSGVTGALDGAPWDVSVYVYTGDTAPDAASPTANVTVTLPMSATPALHSATLTGVTGAGDRMVVIVRPGFLIPSAIATAGAILYDGVDHPSGVTVTSGSPPPFVAEAGGPYSGTVATPIAIVGSATGASGPVTCAWTGTGATFADASACSTTVTYAAAGSNLVTLTATSGSDSDTDDATVTVGSVAAGERVEIYVDAEASPRDSIDVGPTSAGSPTDTWTGSVDLTGAATGSHTITAKWFEGTTLLDSDSVTVSISGTDPCDSDTTAPTITGSSGSNNHDSANLAWTTDEASSTLLRYGTTAAYGQQATGAGAVTSHSVALTSLAPETTYHYQMESTDACGNTVTSADLTFTTAEEPIEALGDGEEQQVTLAEGQDALFRVEVPTGTDLLSVAIDGPDCDPVLGCEFDADLYVRAGEQPTGDEVCSAPLAEFNDVGCGVSMCGPAEGDSDEACDFADPLPGTWYVLLHPYAGSGTVSLVADLDLADQDGDGIPDVRDGDRDGDLLPDDLEELLGGDGGDASSPVQTPLTCIDGILDRYCYPVDTDGDGVGDNDDAFPDDATETRDSDGDGVGDNGDRCAGADDATDGDGDGLADGCDLCPAVDGGCEGDADGDNRSDVADNCATKPNVDQADLDADGRGDACDSDRDGDGYSNGREVVHGSDPDDPASTP